MDWGNDFLANANTHTHQNTVRTVALPLHNRLEYVGHCHITLFITNIYFSFSFSFFCSSTFHPLFPLMMLLLLRFLLISNLRDVVIAAITR